MVVSLWKNVHCHLRLCDTHKREETSVGDCPVNEGCVYNRGADNLPWARYLQSQQTVEVSTAMNHYYHHQQWSVYHSLVSAALPLDCRQETCASVSAAELSPLSVQRARGH